MKRFIGVFLVIALLGVAAIAQAQQAGKVYRIGYLGGRSVSPNTDRNYIALRQGLRELGYVEGQNLVIEYRSAGFVERPLGDLAADLAAELVRLKVDVIVTSPAPPVIRAAHRATRTIPIVMPYTVVDPIKAGFVVSLARPGGNITGLTNLESELHGKRLELLKEAFPRISRVTILWALDQPKQAMQEVSATGKALGIQIQPLVVTARHLGSLESAFSAISRERSDGLLVSPSGLINRRRAQIIDFTAKRRLPTMYARSRFVDGGGLMSYRASLPDLWRRAATYVDKILKGANPADLPVEQATKFELIISLKTAKKLGFTIPPQFLARADKIIR